MELVEDGLVTYPDVKYICCDTVAAEGALEIFAEKKITGIGLLGGYSTPVIEAKINEGAVMAMASDGAAVWARMSIDMVVQILEGRDIVRDTTPLPFIIDMANVNTYDRGTTLAPKGWEPIWKVN